MGEAVQEFFAGILRVIHPEVVDLWAWYETGFHNLLAVSVENRFAKEAKKTALGLLGTGQLSLTKVIVLVDEDVNPRDRAAVMGAIGRNFDPSEDLMVIPGVPLDTLDFTSMTMNLGSKMVIDATSRRVDPTLRRAAPAEVGPGAASARGSTVSGDVAATLSIDLDAVRRADPRIRAARFLEGALLLVQVDSGIAEGGRDAGAAVLARVLESGFAARAKLVAVVSEDVDLDDPVARLWGIFTRFDAARDVRFAESALRNAWPAHRGPLGIDATWKRGYPDPVSMPDEIVRKVDARWSQYGIST
jgi:4-hydroxy-3-polyprenylbenzoate decarboxylase